MRAERIEFTGGAGAKLSGILYRPDSDTVGVALLAHCFTCSKDFFTTTRLAKGLADGGYLTLIFDFTGLGDSGGDFAATTVTTNVKDIVGAAVALIQRGAGPCVLVGHSLGGAAAVLAASRLHTVAAVVAIASPASVAHVKHLFDANVLANINEHGRADVMIGHRPVQVGRDFLDDLSRHDVLEAAATLNRPMLVVQAEADTVVARDQTVLLAEAGAARLHTIAGADHLFTDSRHSKDLVRAILNWLGSTHSPIRNCSIG